MDGGTKVVGKVCSEGLGGGTPLKKKCTKTLVDFSLSFEEMKGLGLWGIAHHRNIAIHWAYDYGWCTYGE